MTSSRSASRKFTPRYPKKDVIYTVRDLVPGVSLQNTEGETALYVVELVNPANRHGIEYGFNAERFAPLETDEDIAGGRSPRGSVRRGRSAHARVKPPASMLEFDFQSHLQP